MEKSKATRVLIVDDSAYVRKVMKEMLSHAADIEVVGTARDGLEALHMVEELEPDVVTLDLVMPRMDGLRFLKKQMARRPVPVLIVSVISENGDLALEALDAGAVDFIQKPTALATDKMFAIRDELIRKIRVISRASLDALKKIRAVDGRRDAPTQQPMDRPIKAGRIDAVVIAISTGGPQALRMLIPQLPADFAVPLAIVLHMPVGYTELYAKKLNDLSQITVVEAREGQNLQPGMALLAPAGRHLTLVRIADDAVTAHLDVRPVDTLHRPSADVLFRSAAEAYGERLLAVVMTGMGCDGKEGAAWVKAKGGLVYTQAEESCVVYGMPRAVAEAGLSDRIVPLDRMAQAIMEAL